MRRYGPDFADRLREAGFEVTAYKAQDLFSPEMVDRCRIDRTIHFCKKPE